MSDQFSHSQNELQALVQEMLDYAKEQGATACAAEASEGMGQSVTVRKSEVETIEYNRDKGIGVSVLSASGAVMHPPRILPGRHSSIRWTRR